MSRSRSPKGFRHLKAGDDLQTIKSLGKLAELCTCDHTDRDHLPRVQAGQGPCTHCSCQQFTWTDWLVEEEDV